MNKFLIIYLFISLNTFSQKETTWWPIGHHVFLDFTSSIPTHNYNSNLDIYESSASISDSKGNLLFYTDGEVVFGRDSLPLLNGLNINPSNTINFSTTQGSLFLKKPGNNSLYYLFALPASFNGVGNYLFEAFTLDTLQNNNKGDIINRIEVVEDFFTEKMNATKHCDSKNIWLILARFKRLEIPINDDIQFDRKEIEFLSYLITENGLQIEPIKSSISMAFDFPSLGQLKFNNKGNELACADAEGISLFHFDKENGKVNLKQRILLPLENGYGIEFSPNDEFLYINEKQFHFASKTLIPLLDYNCPSQLQRGLDGKIYKYNFPKNEILISANNDWVLFGNGDSSFKFTQIKSPDSFGMACQYDTSFIHEYRPNYFQNVPGLPNFPSFYFNHSKSEFAYSGGCEKDSTRFYLLNYSNSIDSVKWLFENETNIGDSVKHYFSKSGTYQVGCITFSNGISDTTFQCISICGKGDTNLPKMINLCESNAGIVNGMNTCSLTYKWSSGDTTSAIKITKAGDYILTTSNGCGIFQDTVHAYFDCTKIQDTINKIPNVFSPNNDGVNDEFSIVLENAKSFNYFIVNRWGNTIISNSIDVQQQSINNKFVLWNGKNPKTEELCTDGVYFYRIEIVKSDNSIQVKNGFLHLIN